MFEFLRRKKPAPAPAEGSERRREPRVAASGEITLTRPQPTPVVIQARLLDRSASGFRASHMYSLLAGGDVVEITLEGRIRRARVVWNRILEEQVESGFLLLPE